MVLLVAFKKWPHGGPWKGQAGVSSLHLVCDLGVCVGFCLGQRNRCAGSSADWPFSAGMTNEAPLSCCLASHCSKASRNGNSQWRVLRYLHLQQVPLLPPPPPPPHAHARARAALGEGGGGTTTEMGPCYHSDVCMAGHRAACGGGLFAGATAPRNRERNG